MVVTWLNKAEEAEEKRARTAAAPLILDVGDGEDKGESSEEDDEDQDEFVYDIQVTRGANTSIHDFHLLAEEFILLPRTLPYYTEALCAFLGF